MLCSNFIGLVYKGHVFGEGKKFFVFHDWGVSVYEPQNCRLLHVIQSTDIMPGTQVSVPFPHSWFTGGCLNNRFTCDSILKIVCMHQNWNWCIDFLFGVHICVTYKALLPFMRYWRVFLALGELKWISYQWLSYSVTNQRLTWPYIRRTEIIPVIWTWPTNNDNWIN